MKKLVGCICMLLTLACAGTASADAIHPTENDSVDDLARASQIRCRI